MNKLTLFLESFSSYRSKWEESLSKRSRGRWRDERMREVGDRQRARSGEELTSLRCPWDVLMWEWKLGMCIYPFKASPGKGPGKSPGSAAREGPAIVQLTKEGLNLYSWRSANATLSPPGQSLRPGLDTHTWIHASHKHTHVKGRHGSETVSCSGTDVVVLVSFHYDALVLAWWMR